MRSICFLLFLTFQFALSQTEDTPRAIINAFEDKVEQSESWEYDLHYKMKYLSSDDTLDYFVNCRLIRHETDTIFGGSLWIDNDSIDRYYDLEHIYIIDHRNRKIKRYFPHEGQDWAINGNTLSGALRTYFLKPHRLSKSLKDTSIQTSVQDTIFKKQKHVLLTFRYADEMPYSDQSKTLLFDTLNNLKYITYSVQFQKEWQYNQWHIMDDEYNVVSDEQLRSELDSLAGMYEMEDYEEPDPREMEPLSAGTMAPEFTGSVFPNDDSVRLEDHRGQVVILDFYYKDCYPCIKAIPFLNRLQNKYAEEDLVILGMNPFDNKEGNREKLPKFIEINDMQYPTVFIDDTTTSAYNVRAYPTFYIIDASGEIIFSKVGYHESSEEEIEDILEKAIK